jgi:hypothetical protein
MLAHRLAICLTTAAAVALAVPSGAGAVQVELTPFVGVGSTDFDHRQELVCLAIYRDCELRAKAGDGTPFGVIVGFDLRPGWQLEILANRTDSDLDAVASLVSVSPGIPDVRVEERLDLEASHLQAGVSRSFGAGTVRPFLGAAIGFSRVEVDAREPDPRELGLPIYLTEDVSEDAFSASAGGGVKVDLTDHFGLRFEGRAWWVDLSAAAGGELVQLDATAGLAVRW